MTFQGMDHPQGVPLLAGLYAEPMHISKAHGAVQFSWEICQLDLETSLKSREKKQF